LYFLIKINFRFKMLELQLNTSELVYQEKVKQEFSQFCIPQADEKWEGLYQRLTKTIFEDKYSLHQAAELGCEKAVEKILLTDIEVNAKNSYGYTPLHCAVLGANQKAIEILLKKGADSTLFVHGMTSLDLAISTKALALIPFFPKETLSPNTFLRYISKDLNDLKILSDLLASGFDINIKDTHQSGCLHKALMLSNDKSALSVIKWLVEHGADIHSSDDKGVTPLHLACAKSDIFSVEFLLDNGADLFLQDRNGNTPLHYALWKGDPEALWDIEYENYKIEMQFFIMKKSLKMAGYGLKAYLLKLRVKNFISSWTSHSKKEA
jgi:hypothetical protein